MNYTIEQLMHAWRDAAGAMWAENIRDTQSGYAGDIDRIGQLFRRAAPWALDLMGGAYNEKHSASAWCGHFQSNCGLSVGAYLESDRCVGVFLDPDIARNCLPSTRRMTYPGKWRKAGQLAPDFVPGNASRNRLHEVLAIPRVATIAARDYGDERNDVGGHFVLITSLNDDGTFDTIEGNGWGELGDGAYGEGVVKRHGTEGKHAAHPLSVLRRIYLFDVEHFEMMGRP